MQAALLALGVRTKIESFNNRFVAIHERSHELLSVVPDDRLFWAARESDKTLMPVSCGGYILRSAAVVEQTFGGITTRLWDDPFEWTLPEKLSTDTAIAEYLDEVEETRRRGFAFFASDEDLEKQIPAPEKLRTIFDILIETIARAEHFQGRAFAVFQMFSDERPPPV